MRYFIWNGCKVDDGSGGVCGFTLTEDYEVDGDLYLSTGEMNLNGHNLTVNGNLIHSGGNMNINGGNLHVKGNYYIQKETQVEGSEPKYSVSNGYLIMTNEADKVIVEGNFTVGANASHEGKLTSGTLEVKGNVTQVTYASTNNFATTDSFKLLLSGDIVQKVNFATTSYTTSRIANFEITNESEDGVIIGENHLIVTGTVTDNGNNASGYIILGDTTKITNNSYSGSISFHKDVTVTEPLVIGGNITNYNCTVYYENDVTVNGIFDITYGKACFNGTVLEVRNMELYAGTLQFNGENLNVKEDLNISKWGGNNTRSNVYLNGKVANVEGNIGINYRR